MVAFVSIRLVLHMSWIMALFRLANVSDNRSESVDYYIAPLIPIVILALIWWHMRSIYKYLVPEIEEPENINFQVDLDVRDPFEHQGNFQLPPYLEEPDHEAPDNADDNEGGNESDNELNNSRSHDGYDSIPVGEDGQPIDSVVNQQRDQRRARKGMFKSGKLC